jgi:diguanylate cyclase (GGDEF)-like protein
MSLRGLDAHRYPKRTGHSNEMWSGMSNGGMKLAVHAVRTDGMTELLDHQALHRLLKAEISRSERYLQPMSLLIVSVRDTGYRGDRSGQAADETTLDELVTMFRDSLRSYDIVADYRHGEFAIILGGTAKSDALAVADRLGSLADDARLQHRDPTLTISAGVATYPNDACQHTQLLAKAAQALREARTQGGSLVRTTEQELSLMDAYRARRRYFLCKRIMDIILSTVLLMVTLPIQLAVALLVKVDSPGPILFRQGRVGLKRQSSKGRKGWEIGAFRLYKFRTMYHNAPQAPHRAQIRVFTSGGPLPRTDRDRRQLMLKLTDDTRVTRVGKLLRKTSLDELPQLINVLKGEMSLVGPRPVPLYEAAEYDGWHRQRLTVPAGMTGLWQVRGRSRVPLDEMVAMDLEYIRNQSLWLDLKILLLTIPAILSGRGAA